MRSLAKESIAGILGNGAAQVVSLATVPIITRLYQPNSYGVFATFISLLALFMPIAALRLNSAIVLPKLDSHGFQLRKAAYVAATLLATVVAVVATVLSLFRVGVPNGGLGMSASEILYVLPFGVLLMGWQQTEIGWLVRERKFNSIAYARVTETAIDRASAIIGALVIGPYAVVLLACRVLGLGFSWWQLRAVSINSDSHFVQGKSWLHVTAAVSRRRSFPLLFSWGYLAEAIGRNSPMVIMAMYYAPSTIGLYALALMVASLPLVLMGDPLAQVFYRAASENRKDRVQVKVIAQGMVTVVLGVSLPPILILASLGTPLFAVVFGDLWKDAAVLATVVAVAGPITLAHRVLGGLYEIYERPYMRLLSDVVAAVAKVVLVFVAASAEVSVLHLVGLITVVGAIGYGAAIQAVLKQEVNVGLLGIINWQSLWPLVPLLFAAVVSLATGLSMLIEIGVWFAALSSYAYLLAPSVIGLFSAQRTKT